MANLSKQTVMAKGGGIASKARQSPVITDGHVASAPLHDECCHPLERGDLGLLLDSHLRGNGKYL